jgi:Glycerophosphoryl diester phosphodiesterase
VKIIAHRGFWIKESEKNTLEALKRAIDNGFGFETDYRDYCGNIVISHNIPQGSEPTAEDVFALLNKFKMSEMPLAINVKADGLQDKLNDLLHKYNIENYFLFDMSIPDTIGYINNGMSIATRHSEYEKEFPFYAQSTTVWLDCFVDDWIDEDIIQMHLSNCKNVCIVSPDLHKRPYINVWEKYKIINSEQLMICTDYPLEADNFFNKK